MSEYDNPVDSPQLPVNEGIVHTPKQFSDGLTMDLTDSEATQALQIIVPIKRKYRARFAAKANDPTFTVESAMKLVDEFEDELKTKLAEQMNLLASVDASPLFEGQSVIIDIMGALDGHYSANFGFDHERKEWEVKKAQQLGHDFLGVDKIE